MMVIRQIEPEKRRVSLEGMYLSHGLQELAKSLDRPIVVANYVTDLNDVIAIEGVRGSPEKLKSPSDWRLFGILAVTHSIRGEDQCLSSAF